jgi:hypothetical protein
METIVAAFSAKARFCRFASQRREALKGLKPRNHEKSVTTQSHGIAKCEK